MNDGKYDITTYTLRCVCIIFVDFGYFQYRFWGISLKHVAAVPVLVDIKAFGCLAS